MLLASRLLLLWAMCSLHDRSTCRRNQESTTSATNLGRSLEPRLCATIRINGDTLVNLEHRLQSLDRGII